MKELYQLSETFTVTLRTTGLMPEVSFSNSKYLYDKRYKLIKKATRLRRIFNYTVIYLLTFLSWVVVGCGVTLVLYVILPEGIAWLLSWFVGLFAVIAMYSVYLFLSDILETDMWELIKKLRKNKKHEFKGQRKRI